jgi:hypothetical protein
MIESTWQVSVRLVVTIEGILIKLDVDELADWIRLTQEKS